MTMFDCRRLNAHEDAEIMFEETAETMRKKQEKKKKQHDIP